MKKFVFGLQAKHFEPSGKLLIHPLTLQVLSTSSKPGLHEVQFKRDTNWKQVSHLLFVSLHLTQMLLNE